MTCPKWNSYASRKLNSGSPDLDKFAMDLGVWYRNLCSFFCAKRSIKEQWADFWDQDVCVQKRNCWFLCTIPVLKLMSSSVWGNWLLTRSHNRSQWFLTLLIQHGSLPVLLEPVLRFHFILMRTNSRIWCQTSEWKKKNGGQFWYTVAAAFQVLK